jgi:hypothetical protein
MPSPATNFLDDFKGEGSFWQFWFAGLVGIGILAEILLTVFAGIG